jgi:hypothetical protein
MGVQDAAILGPRPHFWKPPALRAQLLPGRFFAREPHVMVVNCSAHPEPDRYGEKKDQVVASFCQASQKEAQL